MRVTGLAVQSPDSLRLERANSPNNLICGTLFWGKYVRAGVVRSKSPIFEDKLLALAQIGVHDRTKGLQASIRADLGQIAGFKLVLPSSTETKGTETRGCGRRVA